MINILKLNQEKVVTLIGSGGKTTTMYHLAKRYAAKGKKVLITTTTRIFYLPGDRERFIQAENYLHWERQLRTRVLDLAIREYLVAGWKIERGKVIGVPLGWVDQLALTGIFDLILVEGDGSARKPLKAPHGQEPVIPESTTLLLPIIGLRGVGQPLDDQSVHRFEIFARLTGLKAGENVRPEDLYRVFFHPKGYALAQYLSKMRVTLILNQADDSLREALGVQLGKLFMKSEIDQVLLTSYTEEQVNWRVCE